MDARGTRTGDTDRPVDFRRHTGGKQAQAFPKAVIAIPQGDSFSNDLVRHC